MCFARIMIQTVPTVLSIYVKVGPELHFWCTSRARRVGQRAQRAAVAPPDDSRCHAMSLSLVDRTRGRA